MNKEQRKFYQSTTKADMFEMLCQFAVLNYGEKKYMKKIIELKENLKVQGII